MRWLETKLRMSPLRLLFVVDHAFGISGPHRNVVGSLNALNRLKDIQMTLLVGRVDPNEPYMKEKKFKLVLGFEPAKPIKFFYNLLLLFKHAIGVDLIYVPAGLKSALLAALVAKILRKKIVVGPNVTNLPIRNTDTPGWMEKNILFDLWLEASASRRNHVINTLGEGYKEFVKTIYHAIDGAKFSPDKKNPELWARLGLSKDSVKILHVGRDNEPRKGVSQLIDAIELINNTGQRQKIDFIIVGNIREVNRTRCNSYSNVHFLGFKSGDELAEIIASSDVSMIPSSWENMPFTVLEGVSSGVAVLASFTPKGGIPEIIDHLKSGFLTHIVGENGLHKKNAGEIMAKDILYLVDHPEVRSQLGAGARARALEKFSENRLGQDLQKTFLEVLKS